MRLIDKSLHREILSVFLAVILVLLIVIITTQLAKYLAWAAAGKISPNSVFSILGLKLPSYLIMLVPLGMFLATLLVFGRLSQDRELVVLLASGIGFDKIYLIVLKLALGLGIGLGLLSLFVSPLAEHQSNLIQKTDAELGVLEGILPGKFNELPGGNRVLYAETIDPDGIMHNVFVKIKSNKTLHILKADSGEIKTEDGYTVLTLHDGTRNTSKNNNLELSIVEYKSHGIVLAKSDTSTIGRNVEGMPTIELIRNLPEPRYLGEILWRTSIPLMGVVLMMLGVAFSSYTPRSSKYSSLLPGVVIYFIYLSLIKTFKSELEAGNIYGSLSLGAVHVTIVSFTVWAIWRSLKPLK